MASFCFISAQFLPNMGGVENYTYNLSRKLIERGHTVSVLTMNNHDALSYEIIDNIEVFRLPCINLLDGRYPIPKFNDSKKSIMKRFEEKKYDKVIINTRFYILSLFGARWAKKKYIDTIIIEHGTQHLTIDNPILDYLGQIYEHIISRFVYHYQKNFYGVSYECTKWLSHFGIQAKGVLYNSVDINKILNLTNQKEIDFKEMDIDNDSVLISFTGRLVKEKGILNLVNAFLSIYEKYPNLYLAIAGDGPLFEEINQIKNEKIFLLGRLPFERVIALLNKSKIFCLPSESEGFPTSVLEAIACKNFVITTERGGAKELITSNEYGTILNSNDVDLLIQSIEYALTHTTEVDKAISNSYDRLCEGFTWDNTADCLLNEMKVR